MKTFQLLVISLLFTIHTFAQNSPSIVLFSEEDKQFTVYLNGEQINPNPQTNLRINNINGDFLNLRIVMADGSGELSQRVFPAENMATVLSIRRNRKGEYILRNRPIAEMMASSGNQGFYYYNNQRYDDVKRQQYNDVVYNDVIYDNNESRNENSADNTGGETDKLSNREYYDDIYNDKPNNNKNNNNNNNIWDNNQNNNQNNKIEEEDRACPKAMVEYDFGVALKNVEKQKFNDGKKMVAKQLIESNCLTTSQIIRVLNLFKLEPDRLELAKVSYNHTWDRKNFVNIYSVLKLPSSIEELQEATK